MVGATSSTMKLSWANMCRKGNGEQLVEHKGILMTPIQKAMAAHTAGICAQDENLANHPKQSTHDAEASLERPPVTLAPASSAATSSFDTTSSLETNEPEPFPFFDLPFEIRQIVLSHVFTLFGVMEFNYRTGQRSGSDTPSLPVITVSKRLRAEALYLAIKHTKFTIWHDPWIVNNIDPRNEFFTTWLGNLDFSLLHGDISSHIRDGFDLVRKLSFPSFSCLARLEFRHDAPNCYVEMMKKCASLQEVTLYFDCYDFFDTITGEQNLPKTPAQLVELMHIDRILQCGKMKKIVLYGRISWSSNKEWNEDGIMTGLKQWLVDGYRRQGREVNVTNGRDRQADQGA